MGLERATGWWDRVWMLPGIWALSLLLSVFKYGGLTPSHWPPPEPMELELLQVSCPCSDKSKNAKGLFFARHHLFTQSAHRSSATFDLYLWLKVGSMATTIHRRSSRLSSKAEEGKKGLGCLCWFTALIMGSQGLLERRNW